ncbi:ABC transporter ATP-binding protein [Enterocloster clostridioformis]|nr:ABC transporter ATP-binding protein [Lachnoclostridium sp. YL32]NDO28203.1 ABC transporter ATP-binding protein [Enterocloster clostridioformis]OXE70652.1 ABC transporter ATP-binding protein [Enterocloster clostridioformis]QQR00802.1 ABC transporter ATP-binding protein [Enterocloster clostridioformis]
MKSIKDYILKLSFVFKEIFKAGPGVFFLSIGSMVITGVSPVVITYLTAMLIDELGSNIGSDSSSIYLKLLGILFGMLGLIVISFATEGVKTVICSVAGLKLSHNIENLIAEKFQTIKQERIDNPEFLDLHSNTLTKCGSEPLNLMEGLFGMVASLISLIGYAVLIIKLNLLVFLVIMIFSLPIIIYKRKYQGMLFRFFNERTMQMRRIWYYLSLITEPQYSKEIRGFRLYSFFRKKRKESFDDFMRGNSRIAGKEIIVSVVTSFISMLGAILVGVWLIKNTITGQVSVSDFYLYITAIVTIVTKLIALSNQIASNSKSMMFINYIFEYMNGTDIIENSNLKIKEQPIHNICFDNVSFKYTGADYYALKNINVSFNTNETICLVGENGSGKSTFSKLLLRIYDPTEGRVLLDGIDLREYDIYELRKFFGVLFQDYVKFADNVRNSIGFGNIDKIKEDSDIKAAAEITGADKFIQEYTEGYNTNLSKMFFNDAIEPSGGQWQKIAITRAVFSDAHVLVLDEPTAALDPKSEVKMFDTFKTISELKATIIISHRMYITKLAQKIILLDKGRLIEEGSFEELIKLKKEFYNMYKIQADSYSMTVD